MSLHYLKCAFSGVVFTIFSILAPAQQIDLSQLKSLSPRNIGPAGMSGRVTAIDVDLKNPENIYVGTASGGVWKSTGGGVDWTPVFEKEACQNIGAIAINQQNPSEVWVGTGEGNPRNSHNSGIGIFKSLDGGKSWKNMGLTETKLIHRIRINPFNPDEVVVAALGSAWGPNRERGVFKTTDGGKSWKNVLFVNDSTGCAELVMDPTNPKKLIASMWEFGRKPWTFVSGGKGSGLYISYDGGENWKKIGAKEGLPEGDLGRFGLAIAPSRPEIVYALVEAKENAVYKSTDGGEKWTKISTDNNAGNRPFYYAEIYVDPSNENRIYSLWTNVSRSEDGGRTWQNLLDFNYFSGVHPDHHAMWIHPQNPDYIIEGNDGGLNISYDRGNTWRFVENLPVAQFYHINYDMSTPYNIGGGMQDNGSWVGPSEVWQSGGIRNHHWLEVDFGDGFDVAFRPDSPRYVYAMSQGGNVSYIDTETGKSQFIKPIHPDGTELRFNWDAAMAQNPFQACGLYFGSQFLHKSLDCGKTWEIISPDLTTNDTLKQRLSKKSGGLTPDVTAAENYTTIIAIAPSPADENVIWVGTDDGNLQLTIDGGKSWKNLSEKLPDCPKGVWIPQIEVSAKNAGEAFVVVNHYRRNDFRPFLYHTTDFGKSWKNLADEKQVDGFCRSVVQDPEESNLIFLGTEHGLYFSLDYGKNWQKWTEGFPSVPVSDMKIHPREHDLIIATFGRAAWIMDDIRPLREIAAAKKLPETFTIFPASDGYLAWQKSVDALRFSADAFYTAPNASRFVQFRYFNPAPKMKDAEKKKEEKTEAAKSDKKEEKIKIAVLNEAGDTIRSFSVKSDTGLVRLTWLMDVNGVRFPSRRDASADDDSPSGGNALPGKYKIFVSHKGVSDSTAATVFLDPRLKESPADVVAKQNARKRLQEKVKTITQAFEQLKDAQKTIKNVDASLANVPDSLKNQIAKTGKSLNTKLDSLINLFVEPENQKGLVRSQDNLSAKLNRAFGYLNASEGAPSASAMIAVRQAMETAGTTLVAVNKFFQKDWTDYQAQVEAVKASLFKKPEVFRIE